VRHARRVRDDRGSASTELVIAMPVLLLMIMLIVQFGLWYHAGHVAEAAAREGVRTARIETGTATAGRQRAEAFVANAAPTLLVDVAVTSTRTADTARVEVTGTVHAVVPGINLPVHAVAQSPVEAFRADTP